jgi:hypothetical protein
MVALYLEFTTIRSSDLFFFLLFSAVVWLRIVALISQINSQCKLAVLKNLTRKLNFQSKRTSGRDSNMRSFEWHQKHTSKSRETVPLNIYSFLLITLILKSVLWNSMDSHQFGAAGSLCSGSDSSGSLCSGSDSPGSLCSGSLCSGSLCSGSSAPAPTAQAPSAPAPSAPASTAPALARVLKMVSVFDHWIYVCLKNIWPPFISRSEPEHQLDASRQHYPHLFQSDKIRAQDVLYEGAQPLYMRKVAYSGLLYSIFKLCLWLKPNIVHKTPCLINNALRFITYCKAHRLQHYLIYKQQNHNNKCNK